MTWKRGAMLAGFILLTLFVVISRFYMNVQNKHWDDNAKAVEAAYERSILAKAERVEAFYGDEPYKIVYGTDKLGQSVIVWVSDKEVHAEMAAEAYSEEQVRQTMARKDSNIEVLRILPGKVNGQYIWEVFYKREEANGLRYYYDYYNFKDGAYIDTYRLSLQ